MAETVITYYKAEKDFPASSMMKVMDHMKNIDELVIEKKHDELKKLVANFLTRIGKFESFEMYESSETLVSSTGWYLPTASLERRTAEEIQFDTAVYWRNVLAELIREHT